MDESISNWLDSVDCGWRKAEAELPCVHCKKPCMGRNRDASVAVCYVCYHNVGQCKSGAMCGRRVGFTKADYIAGMSK